MTKAWLMEEVATVSFTFITVTQSSRHLLSMARASSEPSTGSMASSFLEERMEKFL